MSNTEKNILLFLEEKKEIIFFIIISLLGCIIRIGGKNSISGDMSSCLLPWYNEIKGGVD